MTHPKLEVITLNVWGLLGVSKDRSVRIRALGQFLQTTQADLVLLQEVWVAADAQHLLESGRAGGLRHGMHFSAGIFGSGLVTLSRHPITDAGFQMYSAAGDAAAVHCGDFLAGKGVGWLKVQHPAAGPVLVFNTHLHANYSHKYKALVSTASTSPEASSKATRQSAPPTDASCQYSIPQDSFAAYRVSQIYQLAQVVRHMCSEGTALIVGGDLNTKPHFLEMTLFRHLLPELTDCWTAVHGCSEASEVSGQTCRARDNTYKSTRQVPERIDYVLVAGLWPVACEVGLCTTRHGCSYSDHFAVQATLSIPPQRGTKTLDLTRANLSSGCFPLALYCSPGQYTVHPRDQSSMLNKPRDESACRRQVLVGAEGTLNSALQLVAAGVRNNTRHAVQRCSAGGALILAAIIACCLSGARPLAGLPLALYTFTTALMAALGMLGVCMGGMADTSQAQALGLTQQLLANHLGTVKAELNKPA